MVDSGFAEHKSALFLFGLLDIGLRILSVHHISSTLLSDVFPGDVQRTKNPVIRVFLRLRSL